MARVPFVVGVAASTLLSACGADTASREVDGPPASTSVASAPDAVPSGRPAPVVPENPADRAIRRHLNLEIARDPELHDREISFLVNNGDVSVTGTVKTERERRQITDLAMAIDGVKSVSNGLRVAE